MAIPQQSKPPIYPYTTKAVPIKQAGNIKAPFRASFHLTLLSILEQIFRLNFYFYHAPKHNKSTHLKIDECFINKC